MLVGTSARNKATLRDIVFDSDDTLTLPVIDFQEIYREVFRPEAYTVAKQAGGGSIDILCHDSLQEKKLSEIKDWKIFFKDNTFSGYRDVVCTVELKAYDAVPAPTVYKYGMVHDGLQSIRRGASSYYLYLHMNVMFAV